MAKLVDINVFIFLLLPRLLIHLLLPHQLPLPLSTTSATSACPRSRFLPSSSLMSSSAALTVHEKRGRGAPL